MFTFRSKVRALIWIHLYDQKEIDYYIPAFLEGSPSSRGLEESNFEDISDSDLRMSATNFFENISDVDMKVYYNSLKNLDTWSL